MKTPSSRSAAFAFTHPEHVLWQDQGITKQELGDYYVSAARWIMPHIENRPLSLVRCPDGAERKCFFARHAWAGIADEVRLVPAGDEKPMIAVNSIKGLLALVQMNALEIHIWGSRVARIERPDTLIFDLDPGIGVSWGDVTSAARELRDRLKARGLRSFVKTSGGKGLHVTVPVEPLHDWGAARAFTKSVAQQMAVDAPGRYVATMPKARRTGRIFIDYLRNGRAATAIAPYSTRARAGAPVAMPVDWQDLDTLSGPAHYTLRNALNHIAGRGSDPWASMPRLRQALRL